MKKIFLIILLTVCTIFCSCGNDVILDGKTYECEMAGFIVLELSFNDSEVIKSGVITEGAEEKGTYEIVNNEINITWEDGYDVLTYDPEADTLSIGDGAMVFTRVEK